jgi:hypothetical protein
MTGVPFETEIRVELASIKGDLGGVKHSQTMIMACMGLLVAVFGAFMIYQAQELSALEDRVQATHDEVLGIKHQSADVTKRLDTISGQVEGIARQIATFQRTGGELKLQGGSEDLQARQEKSFDPIDGTRERASQDDVHDNSNAASGTSGASGSEKHEVATPFGADDGAR